VRTLRQWDNLVVAPRFGFASAEDYYAKASVAPLLGRIELPALFIHSLGDPMIPPRVWQPSLANASPSIDVHITPRGGHVGFPNNLDLGLGPRLGLEDQVLAWLEK
jgi:predicted alpha/beta-fold hydrolase